MLKQFFRARRIRSRSSRRLQERLILLRDSDRDANAVGRTPMSQRSYGHAFFLQSIRDGGSVLP
jgi:hypothetical protein